MDAGAFGARDEGWNLRRWFRLLSPGCSLPRAHGLDAGQLCLLLASFRAAIGHVWPRLWLGGDALVLCTARDFRIGARLRAIWRHLATSSQPGQPRGTADGRALQ